ncbi:GDYXXLXY domain-containing protein [Rhizobiales bacterium]|uniref:GDYXXLXY domain-containing protein n=1 Tax=Hongsoonwoonella zoysiae TaxID=2821844 RepID=UPI00156107D7|nr:GDYXXLXY domain-containing protein [Hongsoonwoonella zoysiae]NRG19520.1 GDYXXLXY domain-containing protein [Hongsoonwoonella zoysiae]
MSGQGDRKAYLKWGLVALIQLGLVATTLAERIRVHMTGEEVILAMRPVDPRDLLRGDYVVVTLEIERVSADLLAPGEELARGDTVYVSLERDGEGIARATGISKARPEGATLAIRGRVSARPGGEEISIAYDLDAFYIQEGKGEILENSDREKMRLVVALTEAGISAPLRITLDGKTLVEESAF